MPVLDIDLDHIETADRKMKAVMFYPDDPEKRQQYFDLYQGASVTRQYFEADVSTSITNTLQRHHALTYPDTRQRYEKGRIAGGILVLHHSEFDG